MEEKTKVLNIVILAVLIVVGLSSLYMVFSLDNSFTNQNLKKSDSDLENLDNENNLLAVMVEQTKNAGDYKEEKWETLSKSGYTYNASLSGCIDGEGKKIDNALTYSEGNVSITTDSSAFCYLYFNKN